MRRLFSLVLLCALQLACGAAEPLAPPNLVLVIGDDHGYPDFGFMGSQLARTPSLDRLAAEGAFFRVGYSTASVCRPALRSLLTGLEPSQYVLRERAISERLGQKAPPLAVISEIATLPRLLGANGYTSFQAGKHYEGPYSVAGFDEGMILRAGPEARKAGTRILRETMAPVTEFIDRNRDRPFFVWLAPNVPHLPHDPPPEYLELYRDSGLPPRARRYFASVSWFDAAVGALVDHLEARGLRERTLLVYLADNGWDVSGSSDPSLYLLGGPRGKKTLHELGFRTPILFWGPGRIGAGQKLDSLVSIVDVFATLLDYAGVAAPVGRPGRSLRPVLEGTAAGGRDVLIGTMDGIRGDPPAGPRGGFFWRDRRWRYLERHRGGAALYDLDADPGETRNVAAAHPEIVARARREVRAWQRNVIAPPAVEVAP